MSGMGNPDCEFCKIIAGEVPADIVFRDTDLIAFLDNRPVFPGHTLLCPVTHIQTLLDVPQKLAAPLLSTTQVLTRALELALDAEGAFIAINNRISQSVPHVHVHIVPRRKRDGLKGFFWPRQNYKDSEARMAVRDAIEREVRKLRANNDQKIR
jgi:histidine triad (HIT) family protein